MDFEKCYALLTIKEFTYIMNHFWEYPAILQKIFEQNDFLR